MTTPVRTEQIVVGGVRTHFQTAGQGDPVILLHGLGASSYSWRHITPALGPHFRILAPDIPGYGRSDKPMDFDYSLDGYIAWLMSFMDALDIERAAVAGNSMGGLIALTAAMKNPSRVSNLALLGTPVYPENKPWLLWPIRWPVIGGIYKACMGPWAVRLIARSAFLDPACITPELIEEYGMALRTAGGKHAVAQFLKNVLPDDAADQVNSYPQMRTPTLVIVGDSDGVVDAASAERFAKTVPNGRFLLVERCGHAPQEEKPDAVLPALREHLSRP